VLPLYLAGKNENSSKERVVAIRMYAKLKPNKIPTARVKTNVFPTAGLNRPEITRVTLQGTVTAPTT
jgi:hypothetical protein